jgi:hypothetical protein
MVRPTDHVAVGQRRHLHTEGAMPVEDNKQPAPRFDEEVIALNLFGAGGRDSMLGLHFMELFACP